MFKLKSNNNNNNFTVANTVIGEGIKIEGAKITGSGSLRIDGNIIGNIFVDGNIIVGETGTIKGNIKVNNLLCAGSIEGHVESESGVHLTPSGRVSGNIRSNALVIDEGALFSGNCQMSNDISKSTVVYSPTADSEETAS